MTELTQPSWANQLVGLMISEFHTAANKLLLLRVRASRRLNFGPNPLVSVIIPTHNRAELLIERSVASVCSQTYENLEIIVCTHGCTDGTLERLRELDEPRIRILPVPRKRLGYPESAQNHWLVGPVRPLNAGTKAARGDLIALLGDDDEWVPEHLEKSVKTLIESNAEWVSGWAERRCDDGTFEAVRGNVYFGNEVGSVCTWVYRSYLRFARWNIHSWRKNWNRPNDIDFGRRLIRIGVRHQLTGRVGHKWRTRPGEASLGLQAYLDNETSTVDMFSVKP